MRYANYQISTGQSLGIDRDTAANLNYGINIVDQSNAYLGCAVLPQAIKGAVVILTMTSGQVYHIGILANGHGLDSINGYPKETLFQFPSSNDNPFDFDLSGKTQTMICVCSEDGLWNINCNIAAIFTFAFEQTHLNWPDDTICFGLSYDGKTIVGSSYDGLNTIPCYWTDYNNIHSLPVLETSGTANACDDSGTIIVGYCFVSGNGDDNAVYWDADRNIHSLALLPSGTYSSAWNISVSDSNIIVGEANDADGNLKAVYWDADRNIHLLDFINITNTSAYNCSGVAEIIVGYSGTDAVYWDADRNIHILENLGGSSSGAYACSLNGDIIVGYCYSSEDSNCHAVYWDADRNVHDLGFYSDGNYSLAYGCSWDGSIIVGTANDSSSQWPVCWQLDSNGIYNVVAAARLPGSSDSYPGQMTNISGNGLVAIGDGDDGSNLDMPIFWLSIYD